MQTAKTNPIQEAALDTLYRISHECTDKTAEGLKPFNTNLSFNARVANQMRVPDFVLDNATWDELVLRANAEVRSYASTDIAKGPYGNAVNYILINLVFSYGVARAIKRLNRANRQITLYSTPADIAKDIAFRLLDDTSNKQTGYETIQAAVIRRLLSAAQTKAHIERKIQNGVTNYIKGLQVEGKINPLLVAPITDEPLGEIDYEEPNIGPEEELQLEYLYEFMRRGYEDIQGLGGPAATAMAVYCSPQGQALLAETEHYMTTFYTQLLKLMDLTHLSEAETKQAHDNILNAYWQLTRLSQNKKTGQRMRIKASGYRSNVRRGKKITRHNFESELFTYTDTTIISPYLDDEDYELMVRAAPNGFFSRMTDQIVLN